MYIDPLAEGEKVEDLTNEEIERRAVIYNQKTRTRNIILFAAVTLGLTTYSLKLDA